MCESDSTRLQTWPDNSIRNYHNTCTSSTCVKYKQSQHVEPLIITPIPEWPFQKICLDYFFVEQHSYLVVADRYSSWPCVYYFKPGEATSSLLINSCRDIFTNYGVPEEISSDGGPQFVAKSFKDFLHQWGVRHRISSVSYAQSNGRAESAVKSAKRMIRDNISSNGTIDTNKVAKAILQYRNTPLHDCNLSPAQILFHRQLRDSIPSKPSHYKLHSDWLTAAKYREDEFQQRNQIIVEQYNMNRNAKELPALEVGTHVIMQGKDKRWVKTGNIVERLPHRQYRIKLGGSGRITLQNRRFIRKCLGIAPPHQSIHDYDQLGGNQYTITHATPANEVPEDVQQQRPSHQSDEPVIDEGLQPTGQSPQVVRQQKVPRALRNLQNFNKPGLKE